MQNYGFDLNKSKSEFDSIKRGGRSVKIKKIVKSIIIWLAEILAVILLAYLIVNYMVEKTVMIDNSMNTTLNKDDTIIVNRLAYVKKAPERFDVVVYKAGGGEHSYYNIKRIIGLPGEQVQIKDGEVYINGELLKEPIKTEKILLGGFANEPIILEENEYFVLGDNRNDSEDSRFSGVGNIVREDIAGKAWLRLNEFSIINKANRKD